MTFKEHNITISSIYFVYLNQNNLYFTKINLFPNVIFHYFHCCSRCVSESKILAEEQLKRKVGLSQSQYLVTPTLQEFSFQGNKKKEMNVHVCFSVLFFFFLHKKSIIMLWSLIWSIPTNNRNEN